MVISFEVCLALMNCIFFHNIGSQIEEMYFQEDTGPKEEEEPKIVTIEPITDLHIRKFVQSETSPPV